jgi:Homeodomain-like domain
MDRARINEGIRRMRFEDVLERHERGDLGQETAAEILGISDCTFRRWRDRLQDEGPAGLAPCLNL